MCLAFVTRVLGPHLGLKATAPHRAKPVLPQVGPLKRHKEVVDQVRPRAHTVSRLLKAQGQQTAGRLGSVMGLDWTRGYEREMSCNVNGIGYLIVARSCHSLGFVHYLAPSFHFGFPFATACNGPCTRECQRALLEVVAPTSRREDGGARGEVKGLYCRSWHLQTEGDR